MKISQVVKTVIITLLLASAVYTRFVNLSWGLPYPMHPDERNMAMAIQNLKCALLPVEPNIKRPVDLYEANAVPNQALVDTDGKAELAQPRNPGEAILYFVSNCFNPHFFAYGQLSLYGAAFIVLFTRMFTQLKDTITLVEAVMALRILSAVASILAIWLGYLTVKTVATHEEWHKDGTTSWNVFLTVCAVLLFIFSPVLIQFAHFGTTESFLMLAYTLLVFLSIKFMYNSVPTDTYVFLSALTIGLASAAKISSLLFLAIPLILMFRHIKKPFEWMFFVLTGLFYTAVFLLIFSPHNLISLPEFMSSIKYESDVALGVAEVFYTRSFEHTIPVLYQLGVIFPRALGWPVFLVFIISFFALSWKRRAFNILRLAFIVYFVPTAFAYTKWTRFMAPLFPLMIVFVGVGTTWAYWKLLFYAKKMFTIPFSEVRIEKEFVPSAQTMNLSTARASRRANPTAVRAYHGIFFFVITLMLIPGIAFLKIYEREDVRTQASRWIIQNIPQGYPVLSETANVVDIPLDPVDYSSVPAFHPDTFAKRMTPKQREYDITSFNFYELNNVGEQPVLIPLLAEKLGGAQYIFVPSRRIYYNHTCWRDTPTGFYKKNLSHCQELETNYPEVNQYYDDLFSGDLGYTEVARFTSYPALSIFGKTLVEFGDEDAEETWTVFDHPVIRIFKRG